VALEIDGGVKPRSEKTSINHGEGGGIVEEGVLGVDIGAAGDGVAP